MGKFSEEPGYSEGGRSTILVQILQMLFAAGVVDWLMIQCGSPSSCFDFKISHNTASAKWLFS